MADASNAAYQEELKKANDYAKTFNDKYLANANLEQEAGLKADDSLEVKLKKIMDTSRRPWRTPRPKRRRPTRPRPT